MVKGEKSPGVWGRWLILAGLVVMGVVGCQAGVQRPYPSTSAVPLKTIVPTSPLASATRLTPTLTIRAISTASPTNSSTPPVSTAEDPGLVKEPTDSEGGQLRLVFDPVQIFTPGDGSQVTPPIILETNLSAPETARLLRLELYSKEGMLLVRKVIDWQVIKQSSGDYQDQIDFGIAADSLEGWLILRIEDHPDSPLAVNSTRLTLLSEGDPLIYQLGWQTKWIDIQRPGIMAEVEGGILEVSGLTRLEADKPLKIQIVDPQGRVIGQRLAGISKMGEFSPFSVEVPYKVGEQTNAKVLVYRDDGPNGVITHLASQLVVLKP